MAKREKCPICDDDGFIDVLDENDDPVGARDCPRLDEPGHAPFNATGILGDKWDERDAHWRQGP